MDRNSAIGLTLIAALLLAYFYWFSPQSQPPAQQPVTTESPAVPKQEPAQQQALPDSTLKATYGELSAVMMGEESPTVVETEDLRITFSSKGGKIKEVELKKFKSYQ